MKDYNFCYNYGFFADWLNANPKIRRYDILHELGMSDYRTLQNWMEGKTMMPLTQMMKFCNRYNVPLTAFFYDEHADANSAFAPISANSMTEPDGGWRESDRRAGIKVGDPRTDTHYPSQLPEYCKRPVAASSEENKETQMGGTNENPDGHGNQSTAPNTHDERMRLLDIVERQSKHIIELTSEIAGLRGTRRNG